MLPADRSKPCAPNVRAVARQEEALPPEHPAHLSVDRVRAVDLAHLVIPPGPEGQKPYHPHALFGVLARGDPHGVRSSRTPARRARREATFVDLAGGGRPDDRTPARSRREDAAASQAATVSPHRVMISWVVCGGWPARARRTRMRCAASAGLSREPESGVYSGRMPRSDSRRTIDPLR